MDRHSTRRTDMVPDANERPTLTVDETSKVLGLSRGAAYKAVKDGSIPSIRIGHRILVPTAALRRMLQADEPRPAA